MLPLSFMAVVEVPLGGQSLLFGWAVRRRFLFVGVVEVPLGGQSLLFGWAVRRRLPDGGIVAVPLVLRWLTGTEKNS